MQCRVWCLQVAAPGIPVLILAAMAIGSSHKADELYGFHTRLINGLLGAGVCVSSYACDGSATERKITRMFLESAVSTEKTEIPHPDTQFPPYSITLYFYGPQATPISSVQDSKHLAKTIRNILYGGTRTLVIGNNVAHYSRVHSLSAHARSPIYKRDVLKVDRQDDLAATRLLSSATIKHIIAVMEEQKSLAVPDPVLGKDLSGLLVYLFIFGDLVDAFQNRCIANAERVKMVLRAHYFLDIWRSSLAALGYSETFHFITREAHEVIGYLVHGFLSLVLIYRDYLDDDHYPLCAWLHSTESAEHTFGEARKNKADFTFADFLIMVPKLSILFDAAVQAGDYEGSANARAAGYFHTQYSSTGINIPALSSFPTNHTMNEAARLALCEARACFSLCGIPVSAELYSPTNPSAQSLPGISHWLPAQDSEDEAWDEEEMACTLADEPINATEELERLLHAEDTRSLSSASFDSQMEAYCR